MDFQKLEQIGSGGYGTVFRARLENGDFVAVKEFSSRPGEDPSDRDRFAREIRILSKLDHPNILPLLDSDLESIPPWLMMPLANCSVEEILPDLANDQLRGLQIFRQVLEGVKFLHGQSMIHRDLKPQNLMLFSDDLVRIGDFGLGKRIDPATLTTTLTRTGQTLGSFCYMAPEQKVFTKDIDYGCDIYTLGIVLYVILTGEDPCSFQREELFAADKIDDGYKYIIGKCTEFRAERRYASVEEIIRDFELAQRPETLTVEGDEIQRNLEHWLTQEASDEGLRQISINMLNRTVSSEFYLTYFPKLGAKWIDRFLALQPDTFLHMLQRYDGYVRETNLAFSYCDVVGDTYEMIFAMANRTDIRKLVLSRLLDVATRYNRFHVQGIFCQVLSSIKDASTALIAVEVIRENPSDINLLDEQLSDLKLIKAIQDTIMSVRAEPGPDTSPF